MNPEPAKPSDREKANTAPSRFKSRILWVLAATVFLGVGLYLVIPQNPHAKFTWLNKKEYTHSFDMGANRIWRRIKDKLHPWYAPVLSRFRRKPPPLVLVGAAVVCFVPPLPNESNLFGQPLTTNTDGVRAWVLQGGNIFYVTDYLKTRDKAVVLLPAGETLAGSGTPLSFSWHRALKSPGPPRVLGPGVSVTTKYDHGAFDLLVNATDTEATNASTNPPTVPTVLFDVSCHLLITNSGIIVLEGRESGANNSTNYLVMISARLNR